MGAKRFAPEVTSPLSTNRGDGLRSHLTWDVGGFDRGGWGPSRLERVRLGGLGTDIGLIILCVPSVRIFQ